MYNVQPGEGFLYIKNGAAGDLFLMKLIIIRTIFSVCFELRYTLITRDSCITIISLSHSVKSANPAIS